MPSTTIYVDSDTYSWIDQQPGSRSLTVRAALALYRKALTSAGPDSIEVHSRKRDEFEDEDTALADVLETEEYDPNDLLVTDHTQPHFVFRFWAGDEPLELVE